MIKARILFVMEVKNCSDNVSRKLVLIIQSRYSIVRVTVFNKAIEFLCNQAKVNEVGELAGKEVMLDADAEFSCICVIVNRNGRLKRLIPVPCDISIVRKLKKQ